MRAQEFVTENLDQDERVLNHFTEVVADEMGYDPDEVLDNVADELTTPSGIQVYSFSDDDLTYLMGVLGAGRPSALVTVSHAGGGQDNELEISIGGEVRYAVSYGEGAPELTALADQASYQGGLPVAPRRVIARGGPGQDEWNMVGIALDMLWGRMQHRYESVSEGTGLSVQQLATISDEALDRAYGYGRSAPGNTFGWQANLMSAAYAKKIIDSGETSIERIADAIHKGWNVTAKKFVANPDQFSDTEQLRQAGKLDAKLQQRAKLMRINYAELPDQEQEKDRVVARALLQALQGSTK